MAYLEIWRMTGDVCRPLPTEFTVGVSPSTLATHDGKTSHDVMHRQLHCYD